MIKKKSIKEYKEGMTEAETYSCNIEIYNSGIVIVDKDNVKHNSLTDTVLEHFANLTDKQKEKICHKIIKIGRENAYMRYKM